MDALQRRLRGWNTFICIAASFHFALAYTLNTSPFLDIPSFEAGRERRPFQYRALTAWVMGGVDRFIRFPLALQHRLPPRMSAPDSFALLCIVFISLLIGVYATRQTLVRLTGDTSASRWWSLLVIFMAYFHYLLDFGHPCCTPFQLPYDLPSMAFFAVGISLIVARRTLLLYVLLFFAMLNRESAVFLIGIFVLYEWGLQDKKELVVRRIFPHALLMFLMCLILMHGLHRLYPLAIAQGTIGGSFEIHVVDNIGYLLRPYYWASYLSMFGFSWIYLYRHWHSVPHPGIRYAMWIGPIMLVAMYIVGVLSEIRIFGELISLLVIALALLLNRQFSEARGNRD